jgi:hypothetical protein
MTRFPVRVGACCAVALLCCPRPAAAQINIYNSGGFESFNSGTIVGQQGFVAEPVGSTAGQIQSGTTFAGSGSALQIVGSALDPNPGFNAQNFWYRSYGVNTINPVSLGTPYVQIHSQMRMSGALLTPTDIPFAGMYLEGYYGPFAFMQQSITPIYLSADGLFRVITSGGTVLQSSQSFAREQWLDVTAELNFASQSFVVSVNGQLLTFNGSPTVPFRNTNGTTLSLAETGFIASYNTFSGGGTLNSLYADDFTVTRSATPLVPVPEPAACLAVAGLAVWGYRRVRKGRVTAAGPTP